MNFLQKAVWWLARKTDVFDTVTISEWYARNGWMLPGFFGYSNVSDTPATPDRALDLAAFYAGVKIIGEDMGSAPFFFFRRSIDGKRLDKAREDWRFNLLHEMPNPDMGAGEFVETMTSGAALLGDAGAWKEPWNGGTRFNLWPIPREDFQIVKEQNGMRTLYRVRNLPINRGREWVDLDGTKFFHLRGFTLDGRSGQEVIRRARNAIGLAAEAEEFAGSWFRNDISAGLFVDTRGPASDDPGGVEGVRRIKQGWRDAQGSRAAGEPFVTQGWEVKRVDPDLEKMQLLQVRSYQVLEVCRILRLHPHKLADLSRATFSNIEELQIDHVSHTLSPWRRRWREAVARHLLTREEQLQGRLFAEHNMEAFLRGSFEKWHNAVAKLLEKGVYNINEVRRFLNMNPVQGGDKHHIQLNMQAVAEAANSLVEISGGGYWPFRHLMNTPLIHPRYINGEAK